MECSACLSVRRRSEEFRYGAVDAIGRASTSYGCAYGCGRIVFLGSLVGIEVVSFFWAIAWLDLVCGRSHFQEVDEAIVSL